MKKAVLAYFKFALPALAIMPMHGFANVGHAGDAAAFFGLSGAGKTTLGADPTQTLIDDDEHGWSQDGIFNFDGGCNAKVIRLSREAISTMRPRPRTPVLPIRSISSPMPRPPSAPATRATSSC